MDYYKQLDEAIKAYEDFLPERHRYRPDWICDRIVWCGRFKHITHEQMCDFADRMTKVFEQYRGGEM